jgi:Methyltransferase domain
VKGREGWQTVDFQYPAAIPTMLTGEERRYLFWLASDLWDGSGHIDEVGTWLGGSTYCLAAGMRTNGRREPSSRLHCLDNFRWRAFMADRAPLDLAPGDSFRSAFEQNLREYLDLLTVHESRLPDDDSGDIQFAEPTRGGDEQLPLVRGEWIGAPVAVLFEDGAKSWRALVHLLKEVLPLCRAGALLVLQDYKDWASYWVAMAVARLDEAAPGALRLRHVLPENTVTFEVVERVEPSALADLEPALADVDVADGLRLLEQGASVLDATATRRAQGWCG